MKASEDYDFLLRAIMAGGRFSFLPDPHYRYAHSPASLSRDLKVAQTFTRAAQKKHDVGTLAHKMATSDLAPVQQAFTLACIARAHNCTPTFEQTCASLHAVPEIVPPYGRPGAWLAHFLLSSAALERQDYCAALQLLEPLAQANDAPDVANNLAVTHWHRGQTAKAQQLWQRALQIMPGYLDATLNMKATHSGDHPTHITRMPLRRAPGRANYGA